MSPVHQVRPKPFCKAQWNGEEVKADRGRGGKTTSGNGRVWSSASLRGQWRTGKNGENWLQNHPWCPNDARGEGIDDDDVLAASLVLLPSTDAYILGIPALSRDPKWLAKTRAMLVLFNALIVQERALFNYNRTYTVVFVVVVDNDSNSILRDDFKSDCGPAKKVERFAKSVFENCCCERCAIPRAINDVCESRLAARFQFFCLFCFDSWEEKSGRQMNQNWLRPFSYTSNC